MAAIGHEDQIMDAGEDLFDEEQHSLQEVQQNPANTVVPDESGQVLSDSLDQLHVAIIPVSELHELSNRVKKIIFAPKKFMRMGVSVSALGTRVAVILKTLLPQKKQSN